MTLQPRTVPGFLHAQNRGAVDWGWQSFVAYGAHALVVVVDPASVQVVQTLQRHQSNVTIVKWARENYRHDTSNPYTLRLASGDASGRIIVWNASDAKPLSEFGGELGKPVADIEWHHVDPWLLFALHSPTSLCLWNSSTGAKLWSKDLQDAVVSFSFDPFDVSHAAVLTQDAVILFDDVGVVRPPAQTGRKYHVTSQASALAAPAPAPDVAPPPAKRSGWRQFIASDSSKAKEASSSASQGQSASASATSPPAQHMTDCIQIVHSPSDRDTLFLVFPREILIMDLGISQGVGTIPLDRTSSPFVRMFACARRPGLVACQHENGVVSVRQRRPGRDVVYDTRCQSDMLRLGRGCKLAGLSMDPVDESRFAGVTTDGRFLVWELTSDDEALAAGAGEAETAVPQRTSSASGRQSKSSFLDVSFNDGDVRPHASPEAPLRITLRSQLDGLWSPVTCIATAPVFPTHAPGSNTPTGHAPHVSASGRVSMEAFRSAVLAPVSAWKDPHRFAAVGTTAGTLQVIDVSSGCVVRELAVHATQVKGLEWLDADTILSFSVEEQSAGSYRNYLKKTDLRTGESVAVRANRGIEMAPVRELRASHARRYFLVCPRDAALELWDARSFTPIHDMPPFLGVSAFEWSPVAQKPKRRTSQTQLQVHTQQPHALGSGDEGASAPVGRDRQGSSTTAPLSAPPAIVKEHFVFTLADGSLHHYTVEGTLVTAGSRMQPEVGMNSISAVAWKDEMLVTGDIAGNLHLWDLKARISKTVPTGGGVVRKLRFAPGRGNYRMLVVYPDALDMWDAERADRLASLRPSARSGSKEALLDTARPIDAEWLSADRPLVAFQDGCVRCFDHTLRRMCSPIPSYVFSTAVNSALNGGDADDSVPSPTSRPHCTHPRIAFHVKTFLQHQHWVAGGYRLSTAAPPPPQEESVLTPTTPMTPFAIDAEPPGDATPTPTTPSLAAPSAVSAELGLFQSKVTLAIRDLPALLARTLQEPHIGTARRCLAVARHYGDELEFHFWTVAVHFLQRHKDRPMPLLSARVLPAQPPIATVTAPALAASSLASSSAGASTLAHNPSLTRDSIDFNVDEIANEAAAERAGLGLGASSASTRFVGNGASLPPFYDLLCDCPSVTQRELQRLSTHRTFRTSYELTQRSIERHVLLGQRERAVRLLLETDPEEGGFLTDGLRACLVAATISPDSFQNTMKLVGTSLIASGKVADGVELLTLINRQHDACRYLQTYGRWNQAAWLAKSTLSDDECSDILQRWADNLAANGQKSKAALVLVSVGLFLRAANVLVANKQPDVAALLIESCIEYGVVIHDSDAKYIRFLSIAFHSLVARGMLHAQVKSHANSTLWFYILNNSLVCPYIFLRLYALLTQLRLITSLCCITRPVCACYAHVSLCSNVCVRALKFTRYGIILDARQPRSLPSCARPIDQRTCMQAVFVEYAAFLKESGHTEASAHYMQRASQIAEALAHASASAQ